MTDHTFSVELINDKNEVVTGYAGNDAQWALEAYNDYFSSLLTVPGMKKITTAIDDTPIFEFFDMILENKYLHCQRDARELATVERLQHALAISARMVHESFISAEPYAASWEGVSEERRAQYEKMAARLNGYLLDAIRLDVATQESGYVWSPGEDEHEQP